jgi:hypothetical protein
MALTAQQIQQIASGQGGGHQLYEMARNGQVDFSAVQSALGADAVNQWLSQNQLQAPVASVQGAPTPPSEPLFNLGGGGSTQQPSSAPTTGNVAIPASQGTQTPQPNYTPPPPPAPPPPPPPPAAPQQPSTPNNANSGNAGGYINPSVGGGTTTNNDYNRYPTPIPTSPNFVEASNQQGQANLNAARGTIALSNPNVITPYGSQTYSIGPDGRPVQTQSLSTDQQQRLFDLNSILPSVTTNIKEQTAKPISSYDFQDVMSLDNLTLPERTTQGGVQGQSAVAEALRAREQPRLDRKREQLEAQLLTRGFNPGTEGWNEAIDDLSRAENDFNLGLTALSGQEQSRLFDLDTQNRNTRRAELESLFGSQMAKRQSEIDQAVTSRMLPIQEYNSLIQAMQPNLPNFTPYTGATVEANPILDATKAQGIFDLGRYGTSVQGELGTRGIDASKGSDLFNNVLRMFGL